MPELSLHYEEEEGLCPIKSSLERVPKLSEERGEVSIRIGLSDSLLSGRWSVKHVPQSATDFRVTSKP
jgi:hypothetical protein